MSKSCVEQNGRLEMSINNEPGYREVGYELKSYVVAAFKAYISFSSFSATGTSGFKLEYFIDINNYVSVARTGSSYTSKICVAGTLSTVTAGGADASGTIHIERTGMIVRTYYGGGVGTLISSSTEFSTDPGKMRLITYAAATEVITAYADNFVFQESTNSLYDSQFTIKDKGSSKISVSRRGHRDYKNKVTVQYTKRGYGYMAGTIDSQDLVDIDANGLMDVAMRLEGICTLSRAEKMGRLFLKKNINQCEVYAGTLGPQSFGTAPGSIAYLSSKRLDMSNVPVRVLAVKEGVDYTLEVEFSEEKEIYELDSYAWDNTTPIPYTQYDVNVSQTIRVVDGASTYPIPTYTITGPINNIKMSESASGVTSFELYIPDVTETAKFTEDINHKVETVLYVNVHDHLTAREWLGIDRGGTWSESWSIGSMVDTNAGYTSWRQSFTAAMLTVSGSKVRITVGAHSAQKSFYDGFSIGERSSDDDYSGTPTRITFDGHNNVTVPAGVDVVSDQIAFSLDHTLAYLIHVYTDIVVHDTYISRADGLSNDRYYSSPASDETMTQTVTYNAQSGYATAIKKIEVYND